MLETDTQCVSSPRNFCILTEDTILTQRNETLNDGKWLDADRLAGECFGEQGV